MQAALFLSAEQLKKAQLALEKAQRDLERDHQVVTQSVTLLKGIGERLSPP
jgi:hypothetical protein